MCFSQNKEFRNLIGCPSTVEYGHDCFPSYCRIENVTKLEFIYLFNSRDLADKFHKVLKFFLNVWVHD